VAGPTMGRWESRLKVSVRRCSVRKLPMVGGSARQGPYPASPASLLMLYRCAAALSSTRQTVWRSGDGHRHCHFSQVYRHR
jgi:hypothetical protein